jgi:hypothetical protein
VLRERGLAEDAERVRAGELTPMLSALRTPGDSDASITDRVNGLFATEAERVASAAVLAEILLPMLADQMRPMLASTARPSGVASPVPAAPTTPAKPIAARGASIADFIDEMIAQEMPPDKPGRPAQRRAS